MFGTYENGSLKIIIFDYSCLTVLMLYFKAGVEYFNTVMYIEFKNISDRSCVTCTDVPC
jgi:hypothetical protein